MKCFVLFAFCVQLVLSVPQGYNYKDAGGPVDLSQQGGGFKPVVGPTAPCNHGPNNLIQQQSVGRIIHHGAGHGDSQAVTLNSHITVGESAGHSHTQSFQGGQGYVEPARPAPLPLPLQQGPPLPLPGPAPSFLQNSFSSSGSSFSGHSSGHGHGGSVISGGGRVPGPSGLSGGYSGGFGGPAPRPQINSNFIAGGGSAGHSSFQGAGSSYQNVGSFSSGNQYQSGFGQQQSSGGFSHSGAASQSFGQSASFGANGVLNGALGNVIRETFANAPLDPTIEKHIYVHVPPEDLEEKETRQSFQTQAAAKKHYKIIFIKAPTVSQPANYAQLAQAAAQTEEKTIVYVLVKKPEEPSYEEIQQLQQNAVKPSKPEVYFIKYKTRNEQQGGGGHSGGGGGFIGGSYSSNIDSIGGSLTSGNFAGTDIAGGIDVRGNGAGNSIESSHQEGGSFVSSASSSSSSSSSFSTGSGSVNIGETGPGAQHEVYGVPNVK